jgi:hypothetical protein
MSVSRCAIAVRRCDRHGNHWRYTNKGSIKSLLLVASIAIVLFSSTFGNAYTAGYDGEWSGSARVVKNGRCRSANVTLTVRGNEAIGQAKFDLDARNIAGTVRPDGTFGGTIGFQHLTGKFVEDKFEGAFQSFDCAWSMILRRSRPRPPTSGPSPRHPESASTLVALKVISLDTNETDQTANYTPAADRGIAAITQSGSDRTEPSRRR